jgi:hypothetical protein
MSAAEQQVGNHRLRCRSCCSYCYFHVTELTLGTARTTSRCRNIPKPFQIFVRWSYLSISKNGLAGHCRFSDIQ